jgi:HSP20 family molecular chaperone IbpA
LISPVDIFWDDHRLTARLGVLGIQQKDLDPRVKNQILAVRGERWFGNEYKEENFHSIE